MPIGKVYKVNIILQKIKIKTCVFILCLFGLTLMKVSPVLAEDSAVFKQCKEIKPRGKINPMRQKKDCFRILARSTITYGMNPPGTPPMADREVPGPMGPYPDKQRETEFFKCNFP